MEHIFWESSPGNSPVAEAIYELNVKDSKSASRLYKRLKFLEKLSYPELRKAGIIDKIDGAKFKLHELRIDLQNKTCRIYCLAGQNELCLLHLVIKKSNKLLQRDIQTAEERAKLIQK